MATFLPAFDLDIAKLQQFHAAHFPGQSVPDITASAHGDGDQAQDYEEDDGLGYYEDGVKCTLTHEQVEMFRHSEIQKLLAARRHAAEREAEESVKAVWKENSGNAGAVKSNSTDPHRDPLAGMSIATKKEVSGGGRGKRKTHFDEPTEEEGGVVLDY